jgi:ribosomal protein L19E
MVSVSTKAQKRLAASILKCGKRRIFIDPSEQGEISTANSRQSIRKIIADHAGINKKVCLRITSAWCSFTRHAVATLSLSLLSSTPIGVPTLRLP